jgi:hypothetical protein
MIGISGSRLGKFAGLVVFASMALAGSSAVWSQTTFPGKIGVEVADRPTGRQWQSCAH